MTLFFVLGFTIEAVRVYGRVEPSTKPQLTISRYRCQTGRSQALI